MTTEQKKILEAWVEAGLINSSDVWPFTKLGSRELAEMRRAATARALDNCEDALL